MKTHLFSRHQRRSRQLGLTLIEMLVSIAISITVLSGVVQVLVASKSNFISQREMSTLQENARFAMKYMTDEVRQAGYTGCASPVFTANIITNASTSWYLDSPGLKGYDESTIGTYPTEFRSDTRANTDALAVRRGDYTGFRVTAHNTSSPYSMTIGAHSFRTGQPMLFKTPDCEQVTVFQVSGYTATAIYHNTGSASPGNCTRLVRNTTTPFLCPSSATMNNTAVTIGTTTLMELHSEAYYIGNSESSSTVPALFRERMMLNTSTSTPYTAAEELVQGVENMQILYGLDLYISTGALGQDGLADRYVKASDPLMTTANWNNVVAVRITLRMRSIYPIYQVATSFPVFQGVTGTGGSDRYMRQIVSSTIQLRN